MSDSTPPFIDPASAGRTGGDDVAATYIDQQWQHALPAQLEAYIRIPCKSPTFEPDWAARGHLQRAATLLRDWAGAQGIAGLALEIVERDGRTPLLFGTLAPSPGAVPGNVLLYGHFDKQPEFAGWRDGLGPWSPVIHDGRLYGRGGADDGYALFACVTAIAALQRAGRPHPRCVLVIEGSEESGSTDLPAYIDHLADRIGTPDLVVCLDAECGDWDTLWLTTSLRGMASGVLDVGLLTEGVHSGAASGIVPSTFRIVRQLLERIEPAATGVAFAPLHVPVPDAAREQAAAVAQALGPVIVDRYPWLPGAAPANRPLAEMLLDSTWRPTLSITGADGLPPIATAGNTLRPRTALKLSVRLPPTLDARAAAAAIRAELQRDPPYGAAVTFDLHSAESGWAAPPLAPWLADALDAASRAAFGRAPLAMGTGGTIPFMKMLGDRWPDVQYVVTGVLGPHSNAHGPNEFLHLDTARRLTRVVADVLAARAARPQ